MTFGKGLNHSVLYFPHRKNGPDNRTFLTFLEDIRFNNFTKVDEILQIYSYKQQYLQTFGISQVDILAKN